MARQDEKKKVKSKAGKNELENQDEKEGKIFNMRELRELNRNYYGREENEFKGYKAR